MHLAMAHCSRDLAFIEEIAAHLHHLAIAFTTNTSANSTTRKARHHVANNPPLRFGLAAPSISKLSTVSARSNANMMTLMTSASARQSLACTKTVYICALKTPCPRMKSVGQTPFVNLSHWQAHEAGRDATHTQSAAASKSCSNEKTACRDLSTNAIQQLPECIIWQ